MLAAGGACRRNHKLSSDVRDSSASLLAGRLVNLVNMCVLHRRVGK